MAFDLDDDELKATRKLNGISIKKNKKEEKIAKQKETLDSKKMERKEQQSQLIEMKTELIKKEY